MNRRRVLLAAGGPLAALAGWSERAREAVSREVGEEAERRPREREE